MGWTTKIPKAKSRLSYLLSTVMKLRGKELINSKKESGFVNCELKRT